jgi:hypothetical protein
VEFGNLSVEIPYFRVSPQYPCGDRSDYPQKLWKKNPRHFSEKRGFPQSTAPTKTITIILFFLMKKEGRHL